MTTTADTLVQRYLRRLREALRDLPREQRREIVEEIEGHIAEARSGLDDESEAAIRTTLDRLGEPEEIAAEARERHGEDAPRRGARETLAMILLLIGGIIPPIIGWFVGVVLLWSSPVWSSRDKLIGTLVVPGGLAPAAGMLLLPGPGGPCSVTTVRGRVVADTCTPDPSGLVLVLLLVALAALVILPILTTVYLSRRARVRTTAG